MRWVTPGYNGMGNLSVTEVEGYHGTRWDRRGWMPPNFGTRGRRFESLRARHFSRIHRFRGHSSKQALPRRNRPTCKRAVKQSQTASQAIVLIWRRIVARRTQRPTPGTALAQHHFKRQRPRARRPCGRGRIRLLHRRYHRSDPGAPAGRRGRGNPT